MAMRVVSLLRLPPSRRLLLSSKATTTRHVTVIRNFTTSSSSSSSSGNSQNKLSSSEAIPLDDADGSSLQAQRRAQAVFMKPPPRPIFPWRHSTEPLPRLDLMNNTPEAKQDIVYTPGGHAMIQGIFLTAGTRTFRNLFQAFGTHQWREELTQSAGWAFQQAVAGILSNTYSVNVMQSSSRNNDSDNDSEMKFVFPAGAEEENNDANDGDGANDAKTKTNDETTVEGIAPSSSSAAAAAAAAEPTTDQDLEAMVTAPLRELYQSAHRSGHDQLRIRLEMIPTGRCWLHNLFGFPFISKQAVHDDPVLKESLTAFTKLRLQHKDDNPKARAVSAHTATHNTTNTHHAVLNDMYKHVMDKHFDHHRDGDKHVFETTVELQVLVECDELFVVMDATTGAELQGSSQERSRVWHLARLETTVETTIDNTQGWIPALQSRRKHNWQLTDIDDLLGATTWYHGDAE